MITFLHMKKGFFIQFMFLKDNLTAQNSKTDSTERIIT